MNSQLDMIERKLRNAFKKVKIDIEQISSRQRIILNEIKIIREQHSLLKKTLEELEKGKNLVGRKRILEIEKRIYDMNSELSSKVDKLEELYFLTNKKIDKIGAPNHFLTTEVFDKRFFELENKIEFLNKTISSIKFDSENVKKEVSRLEKNIVSKEDYDKQLDKFREGMDDLRFEIEDLRDEFEDLSNLRKLFVGLEKYHKNSIKGVIEEIDELRKEVKKVKKGNLVDEKKFAKIEKRAKKENKKFLKEKKIKKPFHNTKIFSTILIVIAVIVLVFAIVLAFLKMPFWSNITSGIAATVFVVGIVMKFIILYKTK